MPLFSKQSKHSTTTTAEMLFNTIVAAAVLAGAVNAAVSDPQPYKPAPARRLAVMALPGQSLVRRDTAGYKPNQKHCNAGATCAEACGAEYAQCGREGDVAHCFSPAAGESCCTDGSGNSCEKGYYCTHDDKKQTWCCPDSMDLAACAAAYTIKGGLEAATSTPQPTTSSAVSTSSPVVTTTAVFNTTICPSSGTSSAWAAGNSTMSSYTAPSQPTETTPAVVAPPAPTKTGAAASTGVSALLLVAAGFAALL